MLRKKKSENIYSRRDFGIGKTSDLFQVALISYSPNIRQWYLSTVASVICMTVRVLFGPPPIKNTGSQRYDGMLSGIRSTLSYYRKRVGEFL